MDPKDGKKGTPVVKLGFQLYVAAPEGVTVAVCPTQTVISAPAFIVGNALIVIVHVPGFSQAEVGGV